MPQRTAMIGSLPEVFGMVKAVRRAPAGPIQGRMAEDVDRIRDLSNGGVDFAVELAGTAVRVPAAVPRSIVMRNLSRYHDGIAVELWLRRSSGWQMVLAGRWRPWS